MSEFKNTTRAEYLQWAKDRALAYVDKGELSEAMTSMLSAMNKREDTKFKSGSTLGVLIHLGIMHIQNNDTRKMRRWVEGFN